MKKVLTRGITFKKYNTSLYPYFRFPRSVLLQTNESRVAARNSIINALNELEYIIKMIDPEYSVFIIDGAGEQKRNAVFNFLCTHNFFRVM